jgi:hypothetical protein
MIAVLMEILSKPRSQICHLVEENTPLFEECLMPAFSLSKLVLFLLTISNKSRVIPQSLVGQMTHIEKPQGKRLMGRPWNG